MFFKRKPINRPRTKVKFNKKKPIPPINKRSKISSVSSRYLKDIIEGRYLFVGLVIVTLFIVIIGRLFQLQVLKNETYLAELTKSVEKTVEGSSAPRGRIYDRNYKLLVDNEAVNTIYYKKEKGITTEEEIKMAYKVSQMLDLDYEKLTTRSFKNFWYINHKEEANTKITDEEWSKYNQRKLDSSDIKELIFERITDEDLNIYNDEDKKAAYIYYLMNKGYSYAEKTIKNSEVTDEEYALISENIDTLKGFNTKVDWERVYLYGDTFRSILGNVSSSNQGIPAELSDYYLENGYSLDDRVGISYLEYQYENYLKGTKTVYKVLNDNSYQVLSEGIRGNDIVLTIDIELQAYLEQVLNNEVMTAKSEANTTYYDRSFAVISDPNTGEILAMAGKQVKKDEQGNYQTVDYTPGVVTLPVTPGSIVKGASMLVGYKYGAINIGSYQYDECLKIKDTPEKCSWRTMGNINDIYALAFSSNVYQYKIAISVGNGNYQYNQALSIDSSAFDKYREMYASFGLGVKTGIDLPVESLGYSGESKLPGHLLDFSIGQYDTYTPIQISQYINTLANGGTRYQPYLLKEVYQAKEDGSRDLGEKIYQASSNILGTVDVEEKYLKRVQEGFKAVVSYGLGTGYMGNQSDAAGKTGTSQSFIDTDSDGIVDTETVTTSFVGYAPSTNPKMSIVVVSPDIATANAQSTSGINRRISAQIVNKFFEIYK